MPVTPTKLEWEYGEEFGHVFHPKNLEELKAKLQELELQAIKDAYPFYIEIFFIDDSYVGLIVGHKLSCLSFSIAMPQLENSASRRRRYDGHYDSSQENDHTWIQYSFKGSHGEKRLREMLPRKKAFEALFRYITTQKFPPYILFTRPDFVEKYIDTDCS